MLRRKLTPCNAATRKDLDKVIKKIDADAEMKNAISSYVDTVEEIFMKARVRSTDALMLLEEQVDYSEYAPDGFGSCDVIVIADGTMDVIDLKYGKGVPVSAQNNSQMRLYALGAISAYGFLYDIEKVCMTIIQPRLDSVSEETLSVEDLMTWAETIVKPAATLAYEGKGEFCPGEKQCRWCKVKGNCRARAEVNMEALSYEFAEPALLPLDEIGPILTIADQLKTWASDIQEFATEQLKSGENLPGWKLVEGRSNRKFIDTEAVKSALLENGFKKKDIMKPQELVTLTDIEKKLLGKKQFAEILGSLVIKPQGKPTLAPETDPRPAFNSLESDFKDMEEILNG
ncbi:MAG: DUF2800 domain-containing protein [Clostridiales bacterium]